MNHRARVEEVALNDAPAFRVEGLAQRWQCSPGHVYDMIRNGNLQHFRIGKLIRIHASEVERIECASSYTGESGVLSGARTEPRAAPPFVPPTALKRSAG